MLDNQTAVRIESMICKECQRNSLTDLCEYWNVTTDEFYDFLDCAFRYIDLQK